MRHPITPFPTFPSPPFLLIMRHTISQSDLQPFSPFPHYVPSSFTCSPPSVFKHESVFTTIFQDFLRLLTACFKPLPSWSTVLRTASYRLKGFHIPPFLLKRDPPPPRCSSSEFLELKVPPLPRKTPFPVFFFPKPSLYSSFSHKASSLKPLRAFHDPSTFLVHHPFPPPYPHSADSSPPRQHFFLFLPSKSLLSQPLMFFFVPTIRASAARSFAATSSFFPCASLSNSSFSGLSLL